MWDSIAIAISKAEQSRFEIRERTAVGGGCINQAYRLGDGRCQYFVKTNSAERYDMFVTESEALLEIRRSRTIAAPRPVCHGIGGQQSFLALEWLTLDGRRDDRRFGRDLAALHEIHADRFGWARDNFIGSTEQRNTRESDWATFFQRHRLGRQLGVLSARHPRQSRILERGESLLDRVPSLLAGHRPAASLLHGDLWSGNYGFDTSGQAVLFDPASYYGDREADLAMTELFGGFGADFYSAYREASPLDPGYPVRRVLYNLYHVLNHLNLFGPAYADQADRMIDSLLAEHG